MNNSPATNPSGRAWGTVVAGALGCGIGAGVIVIYTFGVFAAAMAAEAGIPVAGGHSIDSPEPIYGLAVVGLVSTKALRRNSEARPPDALILTKPLGVGIYSAAIKKGEAIRRELAQQIPSYESLFQ